MSLTIDEILAVDEAAVQEVPAPEWGGVVCIRRLSALDALALQGSLTKITADNPTSRAQAVLVAGIRAYFCDAEGNDLMTEDQALQVAKKSAFVVNRIVGEGHKLNSVDDSGLKAGEKN